MNIISTEKAPGAIGPYSQGYTVGGLVFTSGQIPVDPATGAVAEGIAAQADQSCRNVGAILEAAGVGFDKVVKTTCFLADIADFAAFNEVYAKYFTSKPARSCVAVKDLPMRQTITSFAGLRAHEPRHDFFIGEIASGFVDCAAIESPGLSSAPAVGAMVADIVKNSLHLEDDPTFDPTRKGILDPKTLPFEERAALIKENPAYGQIICRCESVTEGEIIDAIHRVPGARSLDGVKRRTRAGMGRCQAGFCSPRVMEILARELGVPQSEITKAGGKSKIIVGTNKDTF